MIVNQEYYPRSQKALLSKRCVSELRSYDFPSRRETRVFYDPFSLVFVPPFLPFLLSSLHFSSLSLCFSPFPFLPSFRAKAAGKNISRKMKIKAIERNKNCSHRRISPLTKMSSSEKERRGGGGITSEKGQIEFSDGTACRAIKYKVDNNVNRCESRDANDNWKFC